MIAVTYGLARYAYGLFVPAFREEFQLSEGLLGTIGAASYAGYCLSVVLALILTTRLGPRRIAVAAGALATAGMTAIAAAPTSWVLTAGVLVAGSAAGLASPPMAESVARRLACAQQDRSNALINSGTSVGVALAGPAALLVAGQWRTAWAAFALAAAAVVVWNAAVVPGKTGAAPVQGGRSPAIPPAAPSPSSLWRYLRTRRAVSLLLVAGGTGLSSAAYWTFSRDFVVQAGGLGAAGSTLFWSVIGASGLAGGAAGDLVRRFGLATTIRASLLAMALANVLLAVAPGMLVLSYLSAAAFGASYVMLTGLILLWSVRRYAARPSAGLGVGFLLIALGQLVGSPLAGVVTGATSPSVLFLTFSAIAVGLIAVRIPASEPAVAQVRPRGRGARRPPRQQGVSPGRDRATPGIPTGSA